MSERSKAAWKHNSLLGSLVMAKHAFLNVVNSPTTTKAAQDKASIMFGDVLELIEEVKKRVDPIGDNHE
jgi:hypothetical protein